MKFGYIVHLQLFYKKIQNIDTFIKNEFVQRSYIYNFVTNNWYNTVVAEKIK